MRKVMVLALVVLLCGATAAFAGDRRCKVPSATCMENAEFSNEQLLDGFFLTMVRHSKDPLVCHKFGKINGLTINPPRWCYPERGTFAMEPLKATVLTEKNGEYKPETVLRALDALNRDDFWELYKFYQDSKDVKSYEGLVKAFPDKQSIKNFKEHLERLSKMSEE